MELDYLLWQTDLLNFTNVGCRRRLTFNLHTPKDPNVRHFDLETYQSADFLLKKAIEFVKQNSKVIPIERRE